MSEAPASLEAARARLAELDAAGARAFDGPAFDLADALLAKAASLGGAAAEQLVARAMARADQLAREWSSARARAEAWVAEVEGEGDAGALGRALAAGRIAYVLRAARRDAARGARRAPVDPARLARLKAEALRRNVHLRAASPAGPAPSAADEAHALAAALYDESRAQAEATMTALRAEADLPTAAGPYNPLALAVGVLAELAALSPAYLAALVAQLTDLGALLALPPLPPSEPRRSLSPRRGRRGGR